MRVNLKGQIVFVEAFSEYFDDEIQNCCQKQPLFQCVSFGCLSAKIPSADSKVWPTATNCAFTCDSASFVDLFELESLYCPHQTIDDRKLDQGA